MLRSGKAKKGGKFHYFGGLTDKDISRKCKNALLPLNYLGGGIPAEEQLKLHKRLKI